DGYTFEPVALSDDNRNATIVLYSEPIAFENLEDIASVRYLMGDIIHDFTFTTTYFEDDGVTPYFSKSISQLLAEGKKAIIINNWGRNCSFCVNEMPEMQKAYDKYRDEVEIIGLSNYTMLGDSEPDIESFVIEKGYTFPLMRDYNDFGVKIGLGDVFNGWPLTVVIDRYGAIARIETGAILDAGSWEFMFNKYVSDDYEQDFVLGGQVSGSINEEMAKPDIKVDADHYNKIAQTINASFNEGTSVTYSALKDNQGKPVEFAWPFLLDTVNGVSENGEKVLYSSNYHRANSYSAIVLTVTAPAGKVFTFDYYCDTQEDDDILSFTWDGKIVKQISGNSDGWQTCYLYADLTDDTHKLSVMYRKSSTGNVGKDTVYLKNVRFTEISDITSADMLRAAAYGTPASGATQFPHYAGVELGSDGYYHVKLNTLENNGYAGTDDYPLLLINVLGSTNWFGGNIIDNFVYGKDAVTGAYAVDCKFPVNGVNQDWRDILGKYMQTAGSSDIKGYLPVDKELHDLIVAFIKRIKETAAQQTGTALQYRDNEWLEACYFYSHYGKGTPVGNPIVGITEKTAIAIELDAIVKANLTRYTNPFPFAIYSFTAPADGLNKIESFIPKKDAEQYQAQLWFYDDNTTSVKPLVEDGEERFYRDGENEQNFRVYYYMHKGEKYYINVAMHQMLGTYDFSVTRVSGDSATVLLPCSANDYTCDVDEDGELIGDYYLRSVEFGKDSDGYYRVKDKNGNLGSYIYIDVAYPTVISPKRTLAQLIDMNAQDPYTNAFLDYGMFDFRYGVNYIYEDDGKGGLVYNGQYDPKTNLTVLGEKYKDYTQYLKDYIANEDNQGPENGLIKVDQSIVDILSMFFEIRINQLYNGQGKAALPNEWLRLCWYYRTYDANNN
ncbi:MAG: redoxin domain-containing protein, partial [Clostridia bacterium]|nr:redoxin domain-containing protein [Clostridia bacterium]